jgi:U3 small nucleolar ribonucleoprotein protein IMP3
MRQLKFHEQKLLKKVDFYGHNREDNIQETRILSRYHINKREEYLSYVRAVGQIRRTVHRLKKLPSDDEVRIEMTQQMLTKLYNLGLIHSRDASLEAADKINASCFCRRRLPVIMVRSKMAPSLREAIEFIQKGHVRVGPNVVTDPATHITRPFEDLITWVDSSKIKRAIKRYNDQLDDFELL